MYIEDRGVEPTGKQLSEYSGFSIQDINTLHPYRVVSLDSPIGINPEDGGALVDIIADEYSDKPLRDMDKIAVLEDMLRVSRLPEKEKEMLLEAYRFPYAAPNNHKASEWEKLGEKYGITGRSMSTMVSNYKKKLRSDPNVQRLKENLYD